MPVLAVDIGGTKTLVALVDGSQVLDSVTFPTDRNAGPDDWLKDIGKKTAHWNDRFESIAIAVTGLVSGGIWTSLNAKTLNIPDGYPLADHVRKVFGLDPVLANDAQAAAYGEYRHGAGQGEDIVFLTISTGIGGGIVTNGQLVQGSSGLAGHFGQTCGLDGERFENKFSGTAIGAQAHALGHKLTVPEVFKEAENGAQWAKELVDNSAMGVASLCADIKAMIDPKRIVIGGGVGMAPGYLGKVAGYLNNLPDSARPELSPAALGANAGILGIAALSDTVEKREKPQ